MYGKSVENGQREGREVVGRKRWVRFRRGGRGRGVDETVRKSKMRKGCRGDKRGEK